MGKENLHNYKRKKSEGTTLLAKLRGRTLGNAMKLFLHMKVSDEKISKIESIDLSSFKMQFLFCCYNAQVGIWKDDSQLGCTSNPIYSLNWQLSIFGQTSRPKTIRGVHLWGQTHQTTTKQHHYNHNFECLYYTFTNYQIFVVL